MRATSGIKSFCISPAISNGALLMFSTGFTPREEATSGIRSSTCGSGSSVSFGFSFFFSFSAFLAKNSCSTSLAALITSSFFLISSASTVFSGTSSSFFSSTLSGLLAISSSPCRIFSLIRSRTLLRLMVLYSACEISPASSFSRSLFSNSSS